MHAGVYWTLVLVFDAAFSRSPDRCEATSYNADKQGVCRVVPTRLFCVSSQL